MKDISPRFAALGDWRIAYDVRGDGGAPVVMVHAYSASRLHWHHQLASDWPGRRVVAPDLLGHGDSDTPVTEYSMDLFAHSVAAVLDDLEIERAVLVGHSNGVPVVRQFYRHHPTRTLGLLAVDGTLRPPPRPRLELMAAPLHRPNWRDVLTQMADRLPTMAPRLSANDVDLVKRVTLATPHHVLLGGAHAMMHEAAWTEEPIDVPLHVLSARAPFSEYHSEEYRDYVRRLAPHVEFTVWDDASHFLHMEFPDRFKELVNRFVASVS